MQTIKIKLKDLQPNPYKKQINDGKLNPEKIEKLKESINKDGFWAGLQCRKYDSVYQIPFGHHRVEAAKQVLGKDTTVEIPLLDLSEEQMVRMLANENAMQNEEYAIYQVDTVVMAQNWLLSCRPNRQPRQGKDSEIISSYDISEFLGKKNWSPDKVSQYLQMHLKLNPEIMKDMKNAPNAGGRKDNGLTVSHAHSLVRLDAEKQKEVYNEVNEKDKHITKREMAEVVTDVEKGTPAKEAVAKAIKSRNTSAQIKKIIAPIEGQKIVLMCDALLTAIQSHPINTYPDKGQILLRKMYAKVIAVLTKELEDK